MKTTPEALRRLANFISACDSPDTTTALRCAADDIEHLTKLLNDKQYIQIKADYNKGHLSHAGWLETREKRVK